MLERDDARHGLALDDRHVLPQADVQEVARPSPSRCILTTRHSMQIDSVAAWPRPKGSALWCCLPLRCAARLRPPEPPSWPSS
eukprot:3155833-Pyramimonas_sp.AAC.1